jgi:hypothetical protein
MSSLELGFPAVRNPRSSAVSRIHAHNFRVNAARKDADPFLVFVSTFAGLITSHERSTVLVCAVGVVALHGIVTFSLPRLWHRAGIAYPCPRVCLSFMASDGVDCLRKSENRPQFTSNALTTRFLRLRVFKYLRAHRLFDQLAPYSVDPF